MASDTDKLEPENNMAAGPVADSSEVQEFANTEPLEQEGLDSRWWSESTDGRCSESAALFAASQPAPLNVV